MRERRSQECMGDTAMFQRPNHNPLPVHHDEISEARFKRFTRDFQVYERKQTFDDTLNVFLDLYSAWMKMHEPWMKIRLVMLAFELNRLDPTFECELAFSD